MTRREDAVSELANLVQHHTFNIRVIAEMKAGAEAIIAQIQSEQAE